MVNLFKVPGGDVQVSRDLLHGLVNVLIFEGQARREPAPLLPSFCRHRQPLSSEDDCSQVSENHAAPGKKSHCFQWMRPLARARGTVITSLSKAGWTPCLQSEYGLFSIRGAISGAPGCRRNHPNPSYF